MAVYAIGDIQGCYDELQQLLERIDFDAQRDRLWFAGDLVNRGPKSLETLRLIKGLGEAAFSVLGNHDLHLLAAYNGNKKRLKEDGLKAILKAKDSDELCGWLQSQPLLHRDRELGFSLVHAGLPPQWDIDQASHCAREVEEILRGDGAKEYFRNMYGNEPRMWKDSLKGMERQRFITNCFTRMRYCDFRGRLALKEKGKPGSQRVGYYPWFKMPERKTRSQRIIFGHWSTLGYLNQHNVWAIDSGCLWGGQLTALRLDGDKPTPIFQPCLGAMKPKGKS
ncbi:MAG: symmetrical bis(5'-nucleosyl)-tetraphosphatase [Gammaproteobacteria bacterium]|nr:symmetrical bis(5'-nucleosyl)-tetraphosphatase [Gammaproteobacteria bacterium]